MGVASPVNLANVRRSPGSVYKPNDNSTVVHFSVMFYYTPEVKANMGSDALDDFFDQLIHTTNQGKLLICIVHIINLQKFQDFYRAAYLYVCTNSALSLPQSMTCTTVLNFLRPSEQ